MFDSFIGGKNIVYSKANRYQIPAIKSENTKIKTLSNQFSEIAEAKETKLMATY